MCDTRKAGDNYAEGYSACAEDQRGLGWIGMMFGNLMRKALGMGVGVRSEGYDWEGGLQILCFFYVWSVGFNMGCYAIGVRA